MVTLVATSSPRSASCSRVVTGMRMVVAPVRCGFHHRDGVGRVRFDGTAEVEATDHYQPTLQALLKKG